MQMHENRQFIVYLAVCEFHKFSINALGGRGEGGSRSSKCRDSSKCLSPLNGGMSIFYDN